MIQISTGDVLAIEEEQKYYYVIVLSKTVLGGGNLVYAFYLSTNQLLKLPDLLSKKVSGINAFVDFLHAKRKKKLTKIGKIENSNNFIKQKYFKSYDGLRNRWFISQWDNLEILSLSSIYEVKSVPKSKLSPEEKNYPHLCSFSDKILIKRIKDKWLWESEVKTIESH